MLLKVLEMSAEPNEPPDVKHSLLLQTPVLEQDEDDDKEEVEDDDDDSLEEAETESVVELEAAQFSPEPAFP
jgi:hypothetical protein